MQLLFFSSYKSIFRKKNPDAVECARASNDSQPPPQDSTANPDVPLSDQDLLKQAFKSSVNSRRMGARLWMSERDFSLNKSNR